MSFFFQISSGKRPNNSSIPWIAPLISHPIKPSAGSAMRTTMDSTRNTAVNFILQKENEMLMSNVAVVFYVLE